MPPDTLVPFTEEHLDPAVELFAGNYRHAQERIPLLPSRAIDDPGWIRQALHSCLDKPGVAVLRQNRLVAYMVTRGQFAWKGQQATLVAEYGHSALAVDRRAHYQRMYMHLAQQWVDRCSHLHIVGYLAHDPLVQETLYDLGFGAILAERLRDLSPLAGQSDPGVVVVEEQNVGRLVELELEHNRYYRRSPIFILKPTERQDILADLETEHRQGDVFFVHYEQHEPCAYMVVGESTLDGEGFLLRRTNTAQIKSAYVREDVRRRGVGTSLLQSALGWARQHGYERVFVEHETANFYGGRFWRQHFAPYVYFSMRYVDNTIAPSSLAR